MRMKTWFAGGPLFALTMLMSVLMAAPAVAQVDTGTLLGTVKDQSGAVLPGATVTITHEGQGITLTTVTRADGTFIFTPIRTGAYTVETEFPGFKKGVRRGIPVPIQEQAVVDFSLQPGGVAEEVVVTGESPLLQTGNGTVGETLKSGTLESMPVNGRDYTTLARLVTGVVPPQPGARAPLMFAANGVRPAQNNYLLDGIDNNTSNVDFLSGVAYIVKPPIDAVDEIKIMTSAFSAEYGRAGGAVLNTTLKSGSNQLRGAAWEFTRNDAMNANDFFANKAGLKKGDYLSNQFGFTAGGPAVTNKTFWFADYEGSLIKQARTWVTTVPTVAQRASGFTNYSDLITLQTGTVGADLLGRTFPRGTIFDPATTRQRRRRTGRSRDRDDCYHARASCVILLPTTPFPRTGSTPTPLNSSTCIPRPTQAGLNNNYTVNRVNNDDTHAFDTRVDHNFSGNDRFFARYSYSNNHKIRPSPFEGDGDGGGFSEGDENGARARLRRQPHAHVLVDADQRGAVRPQPRAYVPAAAQRRRHFQSAGEVWHYGRAAGDGQWWPSTAEYQRSVAARSCRLGRERAVQQHGAVQRQPHEVVQVAHIEGRLHLPGHLLRLDAAALRARRLQLGRPLHVGRQPDRWHHRQGGPAALADPVVGAGRRRLFRRDERDPCLSVRVRRCVQDLSWRLRSGQLACERETDGECRPPLGLVQPGTGAPGRAVQHGARPAVAVPDSGGAP